MTKVCLSGMGAAALFAAAAFAQAPAAPLSFDVASVKVATPDPAKIMAGQQHIGLKVEGNRVDIGISSLSELIGMAYKVKYYQIQGPEWLGPTGTRFDIMAKMPEGATKDQVPEMLQALLADRFKMTIHKSEKESQVYALTIAKTGLKMKENVPEAPKEKGPDDAPADTNMKVTQSGQDKATITNTPMGTVKQTMVNGSLHMEASAMPMTLLIEQLSRFMDHPVVDQTGLKGTYQVVLDISPDDIRNAMRSAGVAMPQGGGAGGGGAEPPMAAEPGSSVLQSLQQLGLKLEARKLPLELIVIDHLEKTPTDN